jgi:hypothetical protein
MYIFTIKLNSKHLVPATSLQWATRVLIVYTILVILALKTCAAV